MSEAKVRRVKRPSMRRAVVLFPSGLTLFNLFFGIFAIITASRGDFYRAGVYVLLGGICDALDGRVARAANAGTQFGEELDSLVDAISFGLAPAMIMYFAVLDREGWQWVFVFAFSACAVLRLARFNIEQAGTAKTYFSGLPSPAAGCTLASYYWFSHSWMYNYGAIGNLPWQEMLRFLMAALAALMISPVPYPVFPRTGWRSKRALAGTVLLVTSGTLFLTNRLEYFFPLCLLYVLWGPVRWLISGLFERRQPTIPYDLSEGEDDEDDDEEEFELVPSPLLSSRREARPKRDESPKRTRVAEEPAARTPRPEERPPRAERPERPERPQRTEAELAARREKRDKRDKREKREPREERAPKPARPEVLAVASTLPSPIAEAEIAEPDATADPMDNAGAGSELGVVAAPGVAGEGAAPRKRKRRRRRGERSRAGGDAVGSQAGSTDSDGGDSDGDDGGDDGEADSASSAPTERAERESPYSPSPVPARTDHLIATPVTSAPAPSPAPAQVPRTEPIASTTPPSESPE
jgi:CDP-diacylglycerol--serine O-phosphatidyltransferase